MPEMDGMETTSTAAVQMEFYRNTAYYVPLPLTPVDAQHKF